MQRFIQVAFPEILGGGSPLNGKKSLGRMALKGKKSECPGLGVFCINSDRDAHLRTSSVYPPKITGFKFQTPKITAFLVPKANVILVLLLKMSSVFSV